MATNFLAHVAWLKKAGRAKTSDGRAIDVWELVVDSNGKAILTNWAKHFRQHYCLDAEIDRARKGTSLSRSEYLRQLVFPAADTNLGRAVRSGDFAEILLADILESHLGLWVPRTRYAFKSARDESPKGTDVLGLRFVRRDLAPDPKDELVVAESKAQLSGTVAKPLLQTAVNGSAKDALRKSESLNAAKNRLYLQGRTEDALKIERFQDSQERPYVMRSGASAVFCSSIFDAAKISASTDCKEHPNAKNLFLVVVHSKALMKFVHALYERAADEA